MSDDDEVTEQLPPVEDDDDDWIHLPLYDAADVDLQRGYWQDQARGEERP